MSRFTVIPVGAIPPPGICAICETDRRPVVDFKYEIDYVGSFMVCTECIHDLVNVEELHLMSKHEALKIMEENTYLKAQQMLIRDKLGDLQNALVAGVDSYINSIHSITPESVANPKTSKDLL